MSNLTFKFNANSWARINRQGKARVKVAHNTEAECREDHATVAYHDNVIARYYRPTHEQLVLAKAYRQPAYSSPVIATLGTCGWNTSTTIDRLNRLVPDEFPDVRIASVDGRAVVRSYRNGKLTHEVPFSKVSFVMNEDAFIVDGIRYYV